MTCWPGAICRCCAPAMSGARPLTAPSHSRNALPPRRPRRRRYLAMSWIRPPGDHRLLASRAPCATSSRSGSSGDTTLGQLQSGERGFTGDLLVVDWLALPDFDYVDVGRVWYMSNTGTVTIKSLAFGAGPDRTLGNASCDRRARWQRRAGRRQLPSRATAGTSYR
jgi:hypothetical protein